MKFTIAPVMKTSLSVIAFAGATSSAVTFCPNHSGTGLNGGGDGGGGGGGGEGGGEGGGGGGGKGGGGGGGGA